MIAAMTESRARRRAATACPYGLPVFTPSTEMLSDAELPALSVAVTPIV